MKSGKLIILLAVFLIMPLSAYAQNFSRTTVQVERLSCTSCLSRIESELKNIPEVIGMAGDLLKGQLIVDHKQTITGKQLAVIISDLGYPAEIINEAGISRREAVYFDTAAFSRCGSGGCSSGGCSATAAAWKELYHRIFASDP